MRIQNEAFVNQVELGKRIRQARERIGMSQEALAEGVARDQKAVSEYENGKRKLPATELPSFARVLGVPVSYFFEGEFELNDLDQILLQVFHSLPTHDDKYTAIQAIQLLVETIKRHSSF